MTDKGIITAIHKSQYPFGVTADCRAAKGSLSWPAMSAVIRWEEFVGRALYRARRMAR